ncbi:MAG: hypothetical protein F4137_23355 [Acidobacteria bacterium]|nr:hypothetical protein [Acidobacteriota bacterium]
MIFTNSPESAARERSCTKNRALPPGYRFERLQPEEPIQADIKDQCFVLIASDGAPVLCGSPGHDVESTIRCAFDGAGAARGALTGSFEGYCEREVPDDLKKWAIVDVRLKPHYRTPANGDGTTDESEAMYGGIVDATNAGWLHYKLHVNWWHRWITPYPAVWASITALAIATIPPAWAKLAALIKAIISSE